jgi:hypothetical protein
MADHVIFKFQSLEEIQRKAKRLSTEVTFS